jgi:uncharacterized protein HemY
MNKPALPSSSCLLLAVAIFALAAPVGHAAEPSPTDVKIRLMAEVLRARDARDLDTAQRTLDQLVALSPNDPSVLRLRAELDAQRSAQAEAAAQSRGNSSAKGVAVLDVGSG